jgi:hypothetical protein
MKQIQPAQGGGGGGSMFSKYSGEQINQIPEGYVQAMGQSPIAALISSGLQGFQMGQQMQMAEKKAGLEERNTKAAEGSALAAAQKAATDEGKLTLATEDAAIKGQAALDKTNLENRKFEVETITTARKAFTDESGDLALQLAELRKKPEYAKGDKAIKESEAKILARQVTVGTRIQEFNDKLAEANAPKPAEQYKLPSNVNLTPNDPVNKAYKASVKKYEDAIALAERAPGVALRPPTPLQAANEFKGQLTPEQLKRLTRFTNPFGN